MVRILFLPFLASLAVWPGAASADLREQLDSSYQAWRNAIVDRDFEAWRKATAWHRQILTKNLIVSQRRPFPDSLFNMPMQPPPATGLKHLKSWQKGPTAVSAYLGQPNFGSAEVEVPKSLLLLRFVFERKAWRFDSSTLVNLGVMPEVAAALESGDLGFLDQPGLGPPGRIPPPGEQCPDPDYVTDVHIVSLGYATEVSVGRHSAHVVENNVSTEVVIGGLSNGKTPVRISTRELPIPEGEQRIFQVGLHIKTGDRSNPAIQVYDYKPERPEANHRGMVTVDRAKLGRYAR